MINLTRLLLLTTLLSSILTQHIPRKTKVEKVLTTLPMLSSLPEAHFWGNVNGTNYLTTSRNQHIPQYCGSCWAFASTSAMSDRIKIMRNAQWPEINIAPQVLVSCELPDFGCEGGDANTAYMYIEKYGITDETCSPYQARGHTNGLNCSDNLICQTCSETGCVVPERYLKYTVSEYSHIKGEQNIMNEVYQRGPVACSIYASQALDDYTGGIFKYNGTEQQEANHEISIVGWGVEGDEKYWIIRNSWGSYWGENGFFRLLRGVNEILIEDDCWQAVPVDTWTNPQYHYNHNYQTSIKQILFPQSYSPMERKSSNTNNNINNKNINDIINDNKDLFVKYGAKFDWRDMDGKNYLSWSRNQQSPHFCKSSSAVAVTSSIADRINILQKDNFQTMALSPQVILNCNADSCVNGGSVAEVYQYGVEQGYSEDTCQNYLAIDPALQTCSDIQKCMNCIPPVRGTKCFPVYNYKKWKLNGWSKVPTLPQMLLELVMYGPITCGLVATAGFRDYRGGVYQEPLDAGVQTTHEVSIVGWGVGDDGVRYWVVRNSWGTWWGEYGYMKLAMGSLNVESDCSAGYPYISQTQQNINYIQ